MYVVFKIALFFSLTNFFLIFVEYAYSLYKKDGVYSLWGAVGNVCNGLVLRFVSDKAVAFHFAYFVVLYAFLGYSQISFEVVPFLYCLLIVDLVYYFFHRMHHSFHFLWMFHHVHHGDDKLNLSTAYRISWDSRGVDVSSSLARRVMIAQTPKKQFLPPLIIHRNIINA